MNRLTEKRGITLIALVITIIILIILAAVSINLIFGQRGIITIAGDAGKITEKAKVDEMVNLAIIGAQADGNGTLITKANLEKNLNGEFGDDNVSVTESGDNLIISLYDGEYTYMINKSGHAQERIIKVRWMTATNTINSEYEYTNNVNINDIYVMDAISKTGCRFKEYIMPDGTSMTREKIYNYVTNLNNSDTLVITPTFEVLEEYYVVNIANKVWNEDYEIRIGGVVQNTNTFLKSQYVNVYALNDDFSYWTSNGEIFSFDRVIHYDNYLINIGYETGKSIATPYPCCVLNNFNNFTDGDYSKVIATAYLSLPDDYEYVEKGFMVGKRDEGNTVREYNIQDTSSYLIKWSSTSTDKQLEMSYILKVSSRDLDIVYRPYLKYKDSNNQEHIIYGKQVVSSWNKLNNGEGWEVLYE